MSEKKGKIVFASGKTGNYDIWVLDLLNTTLTDLTKGNEWNDFPKWSPDGKKIAYIASAFEDVPSLWVMDSNGENKKRLTKDVYCQSPFWSPDGKEIYFTANAIDKNEINICKTSSLSNQEVEVVFDRVGMESNPCISPDGEKILFASGIPEEQGKPLKFNTEIWEYHISKKSFNRLTTNEAKDYNPVYSPDGSKIAFVSHRDGFCEESYLQKLKEVESVIETGNMDKIDNLIKEVQEMEQDSDIWLMNSDGTNLKQLTQNSGVDVGVCWSPCGNFLAYTTASKGKDSSKRISIISIETGAIEKLNYERKLLKQEFVASLNKYSQGIFRRLIPDFIEHKMVDPSFWAEERHPDWTDK